MIIYQNSSQIDSLITSIEKLNTTFNASSSGFDWSLTIPVIIAVIGAVISIIQLRYNKLSTARIEWLQMMRENISVLLSNLNKIKTQIDIIREDLNTKEMEAEKKIGICN